MEKKKRTKAIINGLLINGTGKEPIKKSVIIVKGAIIDKIGKEGELNIPPNTEIIDAEGRTVLPGLMDVHVHMACPEGWPDEAQYNESQLTLLAAYNLRKCLMAGITTVRDVGTPFNVAYDVKRAQRSRLFEGAKVYSSGPVLCMTGGHFSVDGMRECDGPWDCRKAVRENIKAGADLIKLTTTHIGWRGGEQFTSEELEAIVVEAHKAKKRVAAHATLLPGMVQAIKAGIDTLEHGPTQFPQEIDNETVELMVTSGLIWVPTLWYMQHKPTSREEEMKRRTRIKRKWSQRDRLDYEEWKSSCEKYSPINFKKCLRAGVKVATGTDVVRGGYLDPFAVAPEEIIFMVKNGLSNMEAIRAATLNSAETLGIENELGSIEPGKIADIIIVNGNPEKDIECINKVLFVMKEGRIYKNSLQRENTDS
jgi:imidazolonepropionase-like amidohydrolase